MMNDDDEWPDYPPLTPADYELRIERIQADEIEQRRRVYALEQERDSLREAILTALTMDGLPDDVRSVLAEGLGE